MTHFGLSKLFSILLIGLPRLMEPYHCLIFMAKHLQKCQGLRNAELREGHSLSSSLNFTTLAPLLNPPLTPFPLSIHLQCLFYSPFSVKFKYPHIGHISLGL